MKKKEPKRELPVPSERVKLTKPMGRRLFRFFAFLICVSILVAAFAVSGIWASFSAPVQTFLDGIFRRERVTETKKDAEKQPVEAQQPDQNENGKIPGNAVPVVAKALYEPSKAIPSGSETGESFRFAESPVVFLYCSNPKEAYLREGETIPEGKIGEVSFSEDSSQTVCAVAQKLTQHLNDKGITAVYGEPEIGNGYLGSSARSGELVRRALREYPQISLVIEIGRDSILDLDGNYIKTAVVTENEVAAQVLAIVGSGESGVACPAWRENLALAKALESAAEAETTGIFRGIRVSSTPQNQQYAPFSLSLLIGSGANTVAEAERTVTDVGNAILTLFP